MHLSTIRPSVVGIFLATLFLFSSAGTIAHYTFDEGSGSILFDHSGNGLNGIIKGNAQWLQDGIMGGSLNLDGFDDYVEIPDNPLLDSMAQLTLEAWVCPRTINKGHLIAKWGCGSSSDDQYALSFYQSAYFNFAVSGANAEDKPVIGYSFTTNQWHYLAGVYSGDSIKMYIDGKLILRKASMSAPIKATNEPLRLGTSCNLVAPFLIDGKIDEIVISNSVLSDSIIANKYSAMTSNGIVAHYTFDEGVGSILYDHSGNGLNGSIKGNAQWTYGGVRGGALDFDGIDDYVEVPDNPLLDSMSELTLEAWVNPRTINKGHLIAKWGCGSTADDQYALSFYESAYFNFAVAGASAQDKPVVSYSFATNQWHYLVGVYNKDSIKMYIDGKSVLRKTTMNIPIKATNEPLRIGSSCDLIAPFLVDGKIDEITIRKKCLTDSAILANYNAVSIALPAKINLGTNSIYAAPGQSISVPVYLTNFEDFSISAIQFALNFDTNIVQFKGVSKDSGIASQWLLSSNSTPLNKVLVALGGAPAPIKYGAGELVRFLFTAKQTASTGTFSNLTITDISIDENQKVIPTTTVGRIIIENNSNLYGDVTGNATTNLFDAQKIMEFVVGTLKLPDSGAPNFTTAIADVSGNGQVTSYDAALIFQYSVGLISKFPVEINSSSGLAKALQNAANKATLAFTVHSLPNNTTTYALKGCNLNGFVAGEFSIDYSPDLVDLANGDISTKVRGATLRANIDPIRKILKLAIVTNNDIEVADSVEIFSITTVTVGNGSPTQAIRLKDALLNEGKIPVILTTPTAVTVQSHHNSESLQWSIKNNTLFIGIKSGRSGSITIYNALGKVCYNNANIPDTWDGVIPIGNLTSGMYFIKIISESGNFRTSFVRK